MLPIALKNEKRKGVLREEELELNSIENIYLNIQLKSHALKIQAPILIKKNHVEAY